MSKAKMYGKQTKYIPNAKADMGKRKKVYQRGRESDGSAAGGGRSDLSEWQRSARSKPASTGAATAGHRNRRKNKIVREQPQEVRKEGQNA